MIAAQAKDMADALGVVARVVPSRTPIPILNHVLLHAAGGTLSIGGADLDRWITTEADADGELPDCTVPVAILLDLVRSMDGEVSLDLDGQHLIVKSGRSRHRLLTLPADQFPQVPPNDMPVAFTMTGDDLARLLGTTVDAASTEETRIYLRGVYVHPEDGRVVGVGSDTRVLLRAVCPASMDADFSPVIVPSETCRLAVRLAKGGEAEVRLSDHRISVSSGRTRLVSKLIEATYPYYQNAIPRGDPDVSFEIDHAVFVSALDRIEATSGDDNFVLLEVEDGLLRFRSDDPDRGESSIEITADVRADGKVSVGFASRNMRRVLKGVENGDAAVAVEIRSGARDPITLKAGGAVDGIVMPMMPPARMQRMGVAA